MALDGHTVAAADDLIRLLDASRIGRAVEVVALRNGRRHLLTITPVERKSSAATGQRQRSHERAIVAARPWLHQRDSPASRKRAARRCAEIATACVEAASADLFA